MDYFTYVRGELHCEDVPAARIAQEIGTPCYVYSTRTISEHFQKLRAAFEPVAPLICYSVKANSNLSIMKLVMKEGAGFDVVSGGELFRALKIGAPPKRIVFAGVGKGEEEIRRAVEADILLINAESEQELHRINRVAADLGRRPRVALRVNPDVDPKTHRYTTTGKRENKFGIDLERAGDLFRRHREFPNLILCGLHVHIGSQIVSPEPYVQTLLKISEFLPAVRAHGCAIEYLDIGGGFGIWYKDKTAPAAAEMADAILPQLEGIHCRILLEPGRFIVGNGGILLTTVQYVKEAGDRHIVICDAGMNDLIRPALYEAYHRIWPVKFDGVYSGEAPDEERWKGPTRMTDVVGPICESGDFLGLDRKLPEIKSGDLLAVYSTGAYGYAMASNYNSHGRPAEVMVAGDRFVVATKRETHDDLVRNEQIVEFPTTGR